jgi:Ca2+-binding RTX toxin-like protein
VEKSPSTVVFWKKAGLFGRKLQGSHFAVPSMSRQFLQSLEPRHLLAAGALDPAFGLGGATAVRVDGDRTIGSVTHLSDGKLLLASTYGGALEFFRLNSDASPDLTFGNFGRTSDTFTTDAREVAVDSSGRIAVAGPDDIALFLPDGTRDPSFGVDGVVDLAQFVPPTQEPRTPEIAFNASGQLVVASSNDDMSILRLNPDGSLDHTFASDGIQTISSERVDALAVTSDGHILAGSHSFTTALNDNVEETRLHVQIHRINPDGQGDDVITVTETLDNLNARVKNMSAAPDGSVIALIWDIDATQEHYVYSLRRYSAEGAIEIDNHELQVPPTWTALEADVTDTGQTIIAGYDQQNLWFTQRYTVGGYVDPTYGELGIGRPNIEGPTDMTTGDAEVLGDGSVIIANTRDRSDGTIQDFVFAKVAGGEGLPLDVRLNLRGTLIAYGTDAADHISLYIRSRDGRLIYRSDDFVMSFAPSRVKRIAIFAGGGDDTVTIGTGVRGSYAQGDAGNDTLSGGDFSDILLGGDGDDCISGGLAPDRILGEIGNDTLFGNGGRDLLWGGPGNDDLLGNGHDDTLTGDDGDDRLWGGGGADALFGSGGSDSAAYDSLDTYTDVESVLP